MARTVKGGNREAKSNGHSAAGPTNGRAEAQAEGQDHLHQRIAERAYILYERSGFQDGKDLEHWLEAEQQIKRVRGQAA